MQSLPCHLMQAEQGFRSSRWWVILDFPLNQLVLKKKKKDKYKEIQAIKETACSLTQKSGSLMLFSKGDLTLNIYIVIIFHVLYAATDSQEKCNFSSVYSATMNELICLMSAAIRASFYTEKETKLFSKVLFTTNFT